MSFRPLATAAGLAAGLAAAALIPAGPSTAAPSAASAPSGARLSGHHVSITLSSADEVGQDILVKGTVTGSGSAHTRMHVQRRIAGGSWHTVAKPRTGARGIYRATVRLSSSGRFSFRAIRVASGTQSPTATRAVYGWLRVARQSHIDVGFVGDDLTSRVHGVAYPHSFEALAGGFEFAFTPACDRVRFHAAWADGSGDASGAEFRVQHGLASYDAPAAPIRTVTGTKLAHVVDVLTGTGYYGAMVSARTEPIVPAGSTGLARIALTTPEVHCALPALPPAKISDAPLL